MEMGNQDWRIASFFIPPEIRDFMNQVFEIYEIRQRIGEEKGISFVIRSNEQNHSTPHVHAIYGDYQVSIRISDAEILAGNLPKKNQRTAQDWVRKHREQLLGDWSSFAISTVSIMTKSKMEWLTP